VLPITDQHIIYEDQHLIAINKPANFLVEKALEGDISLDELLSQHLSGKYGKPIHVHAAHRLDRPVSGVLLFAKTMEGLQGMQVLFKYRKIKKTYWALVCNPPLLPQGKLVHWLTRNTEDNITFTHPEPCPNSLRAELDYQLAGEIDGYHLLRVYPLTGRTHQIRVQLSSMGCPIVGDYKYGFPKEGGRPSIFLHAKELAFYHPITGGAIHIAADLPEHPLWEKFEIFDNSSPIQSSGENGLSRFL